MSGLTPRQKFALKLLTEHGITYMNDPHKYGVITSAETHLNSGQPWIHWKTAAALQEKGLARCEGWGEDAEILLLPDVEAGAA